MIVDDWDELLRDYLVQPVPIRPKQRKIQRPKPPLPHTIECKCGNSWTVKAWRPGWNYCRECERSLSWEEVQQRFG